MKEALTEMVAAQRVATHAQLTLAPAFLAHAASRTQARRAGITAVEVLTRQGGACFSFPFEKRSFVFVVSPLCSGRDVRWQSVTRTWVDQTCERCSMLGQSHGDAGSAPGRLRGSCGVLAG